MAHTLRAVQPDLVALFGPLVQRQQLQRWRAIGRHTPLEDWPRFEPRYTRRIRVRSVVQTLAELRTLGALESCVAVTLQGTDFAAAGSLEEVVTAVCFDELEWDGERAENAIVICNPQRLAFSKDDYATYHIIHRP